MIFGRCLFGTRARWIALSFSLLLFPMTTLFADSHASSYGYGSWPRQNDRISSTPICIDIGKPRLDIPQQGLLNQNLLRYGHLPRSVKFPTKVRGQSTISGTLEGIVSEAGTNQGISAF